MHNQEQTLTRIKVILRSQYWILKKIRYEILINVILPFQFWHLGANYYYYFISKKSTLSVKIIIYENLTKKITGS
jgi:hypothetical protein